MNDEQPRPAATGLDTEYVLTIDEVAALYLKAGHPRTSRSIQRYCAKGHLDARRRETPFGEKFLISPSSVSKHIAYIEEVRPVTAIRDETRQAATNMPSFSLPNETVKVDAADTPRPVATDPRYIQRLEGENEFLRKQVGVKDNQIKDLTERARETNHLIAGLQKMLTPLLARANDHGGVSTDPARNPST